jgi:hypothetical protein
MATVLVITVYAPKPGQEVGLIDLLRRHHGALRLAGVATETKPVVGRTRDGLFVEVLELKSIAAVDLAEKSPAVRELRERFDAHAERRTLASLSEAASTLAVIERVTLPTGLL